MYLILGSISDPCCVGVAAALENAGRAVQVVANPLVAPLRFAWQWDGVSATSQLGWEDGSTANERDIEGVLVRVGELANEGEWRPADADYVEQEMRAALLGWLWSLPSPVVNRYPAAIWYRPAAPLIVWQPLLHGCGLPTIPTLVSNVPAEVRKFAEDGAVSTPLSSTMRSPLPAEAALEATLAAQAAVPLCLIPPYQRLYPVCVVGDEVIGGGDVEADWEGGLVPFARMVGLSYVEVIFAITEAGPQVAAVISQPNLHHFPDAAQGRIIAALTQLLLKGAQGAA